MKGIIKKISLGLLAVFSILGINVTSSKADIQKHVTAIKETSPLYLEHSSTLYQQTVQNGYPMGWVYDHESHYSHSSHESHYSHYSSRD